MAICYSYLLSLLFLLLIPHSTNTVNLRSFFSKWPSDRRHPSFIFNHELTTSEPVLSRRRPVLSSSDRRRRGTKDEILIDETIIEQVTSPNDIFLFNSTIAIEQLNITNSQITEINYPFLRQDLADINQTDELSTVSLNEEISQNNENLTTINNIFPTTISNENIDINSTESEILFTNVTDTNQLISDERNESITDAMDNLITSEIISNETETTSIPISINQTIEQTSTIFQTEFSTMNVSEEDTAVIHLDYTTILSSTTDDNQTSIDSETEIISEYNTTITDEGINNITIISDVISTNITSEDEYSNETISFATETIEKPVCDLSCQCSKECPYGFEIANDTCECDPPCKNYQCFGNDTCILTNEGRPVCQPDNGTEHDRPNRCYQPRDPGYHDVSLRYHNRWYYNPDQDMCHLFVYRGLGGNENNFQTLHECHVECITCAPPPDPGTCLGRLRMWYYDFKQNQCSQFDYSGCKGNENKFIRKQECIDTCITRILNL